MDPLSGRRRCCLRSRTEGCHLSFRLLPHIRGNVGFVFTKEDLTEIRDMLLANKVGEISPRHVSGLADMELKLKLKVHVGYLIIRSLQGLGTRPLQPWPDCPNSTSVSLVCAWVMSILEECFRRGLMPSHKI